MSRELREPNEKLGAVLALAGISNAGLARRVNDLGAQRGLTLRYDKTSVARWVSKGMVPQGAAPHLIAAAIGAKLGRPVPLHEIGLADADPAPEVGLAFPRDVGEAVRSATDLYRLDLAGRRGGGGIWQSLAGSFAVSAYATPASRWLISPADGSVAREPAPPRETVASREPVANTAPAAPAQGRLPRRCRRLRQRVCPRSLRVKRRTPRPRRCPPPWGRRTRRRSAWATAM